MTGQRYGDRGMERVAAPSRAAAGEARRRRRRQSLAASAFGRRPGGANAIRRVWIGACKGAGGQQRPVACSLAERSASCSLLHYNRSALASLLRQLLAAKAAAGGLAAVGRPLDGRCAAGAASARCRGHCAEGARRPPRLHRSAPPAARRRRRHRPSAGQLEKGSCGAPGAVWELGGSGRCLGQVGAGQLRRWKPLREFWGVGMAGAQVPESSGESPRGGACFLPQTFARLQEWF